MVPHLELTETRVCHLFHLCRNLSRSVFAGIPSRDGEETQEQGTAHKIMHVFSSSEEEAGFCAINAKLANGKNQQERKQKKSALEEFSCLEVQTETEPSIAALTSMLHACRNEKSLPLALRAHTILRDIGLEAHGSFGNPLVSILAEVGSMQHAQHVFDMLEHKSESSWNSLITGFAKFGALGRALLLYDQMQKDNSLHVNSHAMVALLNACGQSKNVERGYGLHADIARTGMLDGDVYVGSTLVDMYAKCGLLSQAQEVFDALPVQSIVSWNALIAGYVEHRHEETALIRFEQMQREGNSPSAVTFVCVLKACISLGALQKGQGVHIEITRLSLERQLFVGCILIDMYAKSGLLVDAHNVFDKLPVHDVVSWTALMAGYGEHKCEERALDIFDQMQHNNVSPGVVTFVCILKACGNGRLRLKGQEIHCHVIKKGLEHNALIGSTLVDMYTKCSCLLEAQTVFDKIAKRDVVLWTTLLAGYMDNGCFEEVLRGFKQMQQEGICLEAGVIVCALKACGNTESTSKGRELHASIVKIGVENKLPIGNTVVDMYAKCSALEDAQDVFNNLSSRDVVSWTALLAGYAQLGKSNCVFKTFDRMIAEGTPPNLITFLIALNACSHAGIAEQGQIYFKVMIDDYCLTPTLEHYACLADLLGRTGLLDEAVALIAKMPFQPSIVVWLTLLAACRKWGSVDYGKHAFEQAVCLDQNNASIFLCMFNIYADAEMHEDGGELEA